MLFKIGHNLWEKAQKLLRSLIITYFNYGEQLTELIT